MGLRLTREADRDIAEIARYTITAFGVEQAMRYAALIERALGMLLADPMRPASRPRDEIRSTVRSLHLSHAAGRRHAASHIVYYHVVALQDGTSGVVVLRLLHERMEPIRRLVDMTPAQDSEKDQ